MVSLFCMPPMHGSVGGCPRCVRAYSNASCWLDAKMQHALVSCVREFVWQISDTQAHDVYAMATPVPPLPLCKEVAKLALV